MANATDGIEQLLAELVQITSQIAALTNTITNGTSNNDSNSLVSTANRLALAATIVAVAAFFITALQALLDYVNAGETARRKCNSVAIGPASNFVRKKWAWRQWRRKYYYSEIDLDFDTVLRHHPLRPSATQTPKEPSKHDNSTQSRLRATWAQLLSWATPSNRDNSIQYRPRATWAQLLSFMGYKDVKELKGSNTYVDVDSLSPSLDVTPQLIDVVDMGELLTHMGCDSVRIDVENRDFQAIGSFGSVRTEELPGVGKVLRFQRYPPKNCQDLSSEWRGNIHYHSEAWRCKGKLLMRGKFAIDTFDDPLYMDPLSLRAMMRNEADRMMSALKDNVKGLNKSISFNDPYEFGEALPDKDVNSAFAQWQISHHKKCPIILLTLAIAGLPCATPGFPGRLLLAPFLCQLRQLSKAIYKEIPGESRDISKDKPVLPSIMRPIINNIKENFGPIKLCQYGVSQWGYKEDESTKAFITWLNKFPDKEKLIPQTILVSPKTGVVSPYTKHLLQDFKPLKWARPFCGIKSDIFPAETFPYKSAGGSESHPAWLLKTNVILLDMLIQKLLVALCKRILHKGLKDDKSDEIGPRDIDRLIFKFKHFIIKAMEEGISDSSKGIVDGSEEETTDGAEGIADDSKKETPNGSELFSELDKILFEKLVNQYMQLKEDKLVKENKLVEDVRKGMSQLALFLKLRVLFYAAYLLIIPDTSDIVKAWDSVGRWEFVLPMI